MKNMPSTNSTLFLQQLNIDDPESGSPSPNSSHTDSADRFTSESTSEDRFVNPKLFRERKRNKSKSTSLLVFFFFKKKPFKSSV